MLSLTIDLRYRHCRFTLNFIRYALGLVFAIYLLFKRQVGWQFQFLLNINTKETKRIAVRTKALKPRKLVDWPTVLKHDPITAVSFILEQFWKCYRKDKSKKRLTQDKIQHYDVTRSFTLTFDSVASKCALILFTWNPFQRLTRVGVISVDCPGEGGGGKEGNTSFRPREKRRDVVQRKSGTSVQDA